MNGVIKSIGHEKDSNKFAPKLMKRITHNSDLINAVSSLVLYHMMPLQFISSNAKLPAYCRLAHKLDRRVNMLMLIDLCMADRRGRNGKSHAPLTDDFSDVELFKQNTEKAGVATSSIIPLLKGDDISDIVSSGPQMGRLLRLAYEKQIDQAIIDKNILKNIL